MGVSRNLNRKRRREGKLHERQGPLFEDCDEEDIVIQKKPKCNKEGQEEEQESNPNSSRTQSPKGALNKRNVTFNNTRNGQLLNPNKKQCLNPEGSKNGQPFNSKCSKRGQDLKPKNSKNGQQPTSKISKERDTCHVKVEEDRAGGKLLVVPPKREAGSLSVFLTNLEAGVQKKDIKRFFKGCNIDNMHLAIDKSTSRFRGYGHVDFSDEKSLEKAIKMDQKQLLGRPVKISCTVPKGFSAKFDGMD